MGPGRSYSLLGVIGVAALLSAGMVTREQAEDHITREPLPEPEPRPRVWDGPTNRGSGPGAQRAKEREAREAERREALYAAVGHGEGERSSSRANQKNQPQKDPNHV